MTSYRARVERDGKFWAVEVDGVGPTQARHRGELEAMTRDLIGTVVDDAGDFTVTYEFGPGIGADESERQ